MIALSTRALRMLSREVMGLHAAFYVLAASALLSSLLALLRDRLLAHSFGAGVTLDLYYAAFRIPDLIFVGTGALVSVYILIPELVRRTSDEQKAYIDTVVAGFSTLAVIVAGTAALFAPPVLRALFPAFIDAGHLPVLVLVTRIMLLQPILLGLSNILAGITQSRHRYWLYSVSPLLYNVGIIFGTLVLYPIFGIAGLAWGVVLGAAMHFGIQLPSALADGFFARVPRLRDPRAFYKTITISIPRALALSMNQIAFIGLTALAGMLASGSIAVFMFAYNLQAVPLSVIGASYSVAAFPMLAAAISRGARETFVGHIATAARYVLFWSVPASALIIVLRAHIVRVILGSGAFDWTDTRLTAAGLALFALALPAQGLTLLLVRGYYAAGRTMVPFAVALMSAVGMIAVGVLSVGAFKSTVIADFTQELLRVAGVPGSDVLALTFAYASVAIAGAVVLAMHFNSRFRGFWARVRRTAGESVVTALSAGAVAYGVLFLVGPIDLYSTTLSVFARGLFGGICGIIAAALVSYALGSREYGETIAGLRARLWRTQIPSEAVASTEESSSSIS
ncbi:MAG: lipid II flippase MurJ [Patescibacteria group bacterium]|nr:lipid II flippase MurJ [bacterium]MDZ4227122.1 lipid II flippase MurJ [Patescibacteria group bacterium]